MNHIIPYIEKRMKAKGFSNFHIEPVSAFAESRKFVIQAQNEFYFLLNENLQAGTIIQSDTEVLVVPANLVSSKSSFLREFTGQIMIEQTLETRQTFEFLKVIPE